jgi:hypothetical protein
MRIIPTRLHGVLDYLMGGLVAVSPWLFGYADGGTTAMVHLMLGAGMILIALMTDFELGVIRAIPMPAHLMLDAGLGVFALASPWLFGFATFSTLHVALGLFELAAAAMTSTHPATRSVRA